VTWPSCPFSPPLSLPQPRRAGRPIILVSLSQDGLVTTSSEYRAAGARAGALAVQTTAVRESTWAQVPGLAAVESAVFPTREALEAVRAGAAEVAMETTYLSPDLRVARTQDPASAGGAHVWVWARKR